MWMRTTFCSVINSEPEAMSYEVKAMKVRESLPNENRIELGSGNVFADLGFRNAEDRLLKAKLTTQIAQLIEKNGWTPAQTAERTSLDQPKVPLLLCGKLSGFSADRLFAVLNRLAHSVEVCLSAKDDSELGAWLHCQNKRKD
jgi:predicted XRE-type DNA-binding protein